MSDEQRLPPELKAKWLVALRSGEYQQAKGALRTIEGEKCMCCLGVLCDVIDPNGWRSIEGQAWRWGPDLPGQSHIQYLPPNLRTAYGFSEIIRDEYGLSVESALANRNDGAIDGHPRWTFAQIADWIEERL